MTCVFMAMGTGPCEGATFGQALSNMASFVSDLSVDGAHFLANPTVGSYEGRYPFEVDYGGRRVEVLMPGLPIERVRYLDPKTQNCLDFKRLYVGGNSWLWKYAIDMVKTELLGDAQLL